MRITTVNPPTFGGLRMGPTLHEMSFNASEVKTLRRAAQIMNEADEKAIAYDPEWMDGSEIRTDIAMCGYTLSDVVEEKGFHIQEDWSGV